MKTFEHTEKDLAFVDAVEIDLIKRVKHSKPTVEKLAARFGIENKNLIKELTELAIVRIAKGIAHKNTLTIKEKYIQIVDLYRHQVNLSHRTSESILLQQYSTPAPIGYLMGIYVLNENNALNGNGYKAFKTKWGVNVGERKPTQIDSPPARQYLEPSAGNGLLTVALNPQDVIVNELDDVRNANLTTQGFAQVLRFDASKDYANDSNYYRHFIGIITNPPFGSLEHDIIFGKGNDKFPIKTLDHVMCLRALDCMDSTGRAAMIIGGHTTWDDRGRIQAGKNRIFFNYLYRYYFVDDVINIDGKKLYSRQGTAFNVRLLLVKGRKYEAEGVAPLKQIHDTVVDSFSELWDRVMLSMDNTEIPDNTDKTMRVVALSKRFQQIREQLQSMGGLSGVEISRIERRTMKK